MTQQEIEALETEVSRLRVSVADAYNDNRDAADKLWNAERALSIARQQST